jgi:hypothetical protein
MICSDDTLSIRRQTALLGVSRSSYYNGPPKPESEENVAVMNFMDTEYHVRPATGVRKLRNLLMRDGIVERIGVDRIRRLRGKMGLQTVYRSPRTTIPGPSSMIRRHPQRAQTLQSACFTLPLPRRPGQRGRACSSCVDRAQCQLRLQLHLRITSELGEHPAILEIGRASFSSLRALVQDIGGEEELYGMPIILRVVEDGTYHSVHFESAY